MLNNIGPYTSMPFEIRIIYYTLLIAYFIKYMKQTKEEIFLRTV